MHVPAPVAGGPDHALIAAPQSPDSTNLQSPTLSGLVQAPMQLKRHQRTAKVVCKSIELQLYTNIYMYTCVYTNA